MSLLARDRWRFSLAAEIGIMFVLLGLMPLFVIGWSYFTSAERQLQAEISQSLSAVADGKVGRLEAYANDRMREAGGAGKHARDCRRYHCFHQWLPCRWPDGGCMAGRVGGL